MTCEFKETCPLYNVRSFTCSHSAVSYRGGVVCKQAEKLKKWGLNRSIDEEMLFQQTGKVRSRA
jgi:hypothetical protein